MDAPSFNCPHCGHPLPHTHVERLSRDLLEAAYILSDEEARFLVDAYYIIQEDRKRSANQIRSMEEEPHRLLSWFYDQNRILESQLKNALDRYSSSKPIGRWMKCAPPESRVLVSSGRWSSYKTIPIGELSDGDMVVSFNRHHARMTLPVPVKVGVRQYDGQLVTVQTLNEQTRTTPNHKWLVRIEEDLHGEVVYLMEERGRFRVGRCQAVLPPSTGRKNGRLALRGRARQEGAEKIWILKFCNSREAAIYEALTSITYGLPQTRFSGRYGAVRFDQEAIDELFERLDPIVQQHRAVQCLHDHGLSVHMPLVDDIGYGTKESVAGLTVQAGNLVPELMSVPTPLRGGGIEWRRIEKISSENYSGSVFSLDVAKHHRYVQDGLVTCNSIYGIGPVISAGLMAHIDIRKAPTVGNIYRFAGLDPTVKWEKGKKRPFNASLKTLCWKIGMSFMRFHKRDDCWYGKLYETRKDYEEQRNETLGNRERAAELLPHFDPDTEAYGHLNNGKLPPAHIDAQARRWTTKIFLSHVHEIWFELHNGTKPPKAFAIALLGHADYIAPPSKPPELSPTT